jgi:DNA invertase Pin-like site-specific DNA recombinase
MATSVWTETFVTLHKYRRGKGYDLFHRSCRLLPSFDVFFHTEEPMRTLAYLRVSKHTQDVNHQRLAILEFARRERLTVDEFIAVEVSSRRSSKARKVDVLLMQLAPGDTLIVSELSRLGRSVGEIITTIDTLVKRQIQLLAIKEDIRLHGGPALQTRVMVTMFSLFAEIERELISLRTKEALAAARAAGKRLGRPRGIHGRSKLDGKETQIKEFLELHVSKASIAKITGVDRATLYHFIRSRRLGEIGQSPRTRPL